MCHGYATRACTSESEGRCSAGQPQQNPCKLMAPDGAPAWSAERLHRSNLSKSLMSARGRLSARGQPLFAASVIARSLVDQRRAQDAFVPASRAPHCCCELCSKWHPAQRNRATSRGPLCQRRAWRHDAEQRARETRLALSPLATRRANDLLTLLTRSCCGVLSRGKTASLAFPQVIRGAAKM